MNSDHIKRDWHSRGYSFGVFRDPSGQIWADFVHRTDELVLLAEGEIEVEIEGKAEKSKIGDFNYTCKLGQSIPVQFDYFLVIFIN